MNDVNYEKVDPVSIKNQALILRVQSSAFASTCKSVSQIFDAMYNVVNHADGGLGKAINDIVNIYNDIGVKSKEHFDSLSDTMEKWADTSISNEQDSLEKIQRISAELNDIDGLLNQLK